MAKKETFEFIVSAKAGSVWKTDPTTGDVLRNQGGTDRLGRVKVTYGGTVHLTEKRAKDLGPDVVLPKAEWLKSQTAVVNEAITSKDQEIADLKAKLAALDGGEKPKRGRKPAEAATE